MEQSYPVSGVLQVRQKLLLTVAGRRLVGEVFNSTSPRLDILIFAVEAMVDFCMVWFSSVVLACVVSSRHLDAVFN